MIERRGNLFEQTDVDAICLTTNGAVRKDGACVMGRGVAAEAKEKWPGIECVLGHYISKSGNVVRRVTGVYDRSSPMLWDEVAVGGSPDSDGIVTPCHIVAFPVKHHWKDRADLLLIQRSAKQLVELTDREGWEKVALVRPGCGNGRLSWRNVRPLLEPVLDDRFIIVQL